MTDITSTYFPEGLFGTYSETRQAARLIAKQVWETGDWQSIEAVTPMVPLDTHQGEIMLEAGEPEGRSRQKHWRIWWVLKELNRLCGWVDNDSQRRLRQLMLEGMNNHLWFAIAMLGAENADIPLHFKSDGTTTENYRIFCKAMLANVLKWVPQVSAVSHLFGGELFTAARWNHHFRHDWVSLIVFCAVRTGYPLTGRDSIHSKFGGDVTRWLIAENVAEYRGGELALREQTGGSK